MRSAARNRWEWTIVVVAAAVALVLGMVGFARLDPDAPFTELLYRSLQLFTLESGAVAEGSAPLSLEIARLLAPVVAAYAAVRAVLLLVRDRLSLLRVRLFARRHAVVAGLGAKGFTLARRLAEAGARVVVVERDGDNPSVAGCRARRIPVLVGDASDPAVLARVGAERAAVLYVTTGDDRRNIDVGFALDALPVPTRGPRPTVLVHLDDVALWRRLAARLVSGPRPRPVRVAFFSVRETAARMLVERQPPFPPTGGLPRRATALVVGGSGFGESVIVAAAAAWRRSRPAADEELAIVVAGPAAARERDVIARRHPELEQVCRLVAWEAELDDLADAPASDAVYVCLPDETEGLVAGLALDSARRSGGPIVLAVTDAATGLASALRDRTARLRPFGVLGEALDPEAIGHGTNEILARAKHAHYVASELERGIGPAENPSVVPWEELDESLKESNRLFADSVGGKLAAAGCAVVPEPLADPEHPSFAFSDAEVERLARAEHDRWWNDLAAEGWTPGPVKDAAAKVHPSLVSWSELSEEERDKDREPIRSLPAMLAHVGFGITRGVDAAEPKAAGRTEVPLGSAG